MLPRRWSTISDSKFDDIRVIVPQAAMSAATMLACAANRIVMGKHSSLGPIDPQFIIPTQGGTMAHPAQAILDQFDLAKDECKDPQLLGAWIPILPQYGPSLLVQCMNALDLAEGLVAEWLRTWMLASLGPTTAARKARKIARKLADHTKFKSHGRPYRLYFYSADREEPPHVHVERDECSAKYWLDPIRLDQSVGFGRKELRTVEALISANASGLRKAWHDHFTS